MWKRILNYEINEYDCFPIAPDKQAPRTIQAFLKAHGYSSAVIRHLKETENGIQKNGVWTRVHDTLVPGDTLTLVLAEDSSSENIVPSPLPLSVVYEDEDLLVINKPAGMPIHPSQGNYDNTLANACAFYFEQKGEPFTYRCINRLDRDTTGLLIIARHAYSASLLSVMVSQREIHREYRALARGLVPESGTIEAPIARASGSTIEREVNFENGEYACTHYQRLAYTTLPSCNSSMSDRENGYSLVSLKLDTGRTHQIRVHMKYIGHPLPGDFLYNPDYSIIGRQALHSCRLSFAHPITGENLDFTAPLPADMLITDSFRFI